MGFRVRPKPSGGFMVYAGTATEAVRVAKAMLQRDVGEIEIVDDEDRRLNLADLERLVQTETGEESTED